MDYRTVREMNPSLPQEDPSLSSEHRASKGKRSSMILLGFRLFLGVIFLYASFDKIVHPVPFAEIVYNYQILPDALVNLVSLFLPWLELLTGLCLILGIWLPGAVLLCNLLLLVFFGALLFNLARGLDIDCGCFTSSMGPSSGGRMLWYLARDGFFLLVGGFLFFSFFPGKRNTVWKFHRSWKPALGQILALALLALLLGLPVNRVRSGSIPLFGDWSPEARMALKYGRTLLIPLDEAKAQFLNGSAVFVDVRPPELYQEGHIQGAINLPFAEFDQMIDKILTDLPEEVLIVTYCDGDDCVLSAELAIRLKEFGYEKVRVLHNGWSVWKSHHLPSETGQPLG